METKEFTKPDDLIEWLAGPYLSDWMSALQENKDLIIEGEREAAEDSEDEIDFDPATVDLSQIVEGTVGEPSNPFVMLRPVQDVKVTLNGKEIPLYGDKTIFWLSECDLAWYYNWLDKKVDLDFSISDAVRFFADGYLTAFCE